MQLFAPNIYTNGPNYDLYPIFLISIADLILVGGNDFSHSPIITIEKTTGLNF